MEDGEKFLNNFKGSLPPVPTCTILFTRNYLGRPASLFASMILAVDETFVPFGTSGTRDRVHTQGKKKRSAATAKSYCNKRNA